MICGHHTGHWAKLLSCLFQCWNTTHDTLSDHKCLQTLHLRMLHIKMQCDQSKTNDSPRSLFDQAFEKRCWSHILSRSAYTFWQSLISFNTVCICTSVMFKAYGSHRAQWFKDRSIRFQVLFYIQRSWSSHSRLLFTFSDTRDSDSFMNCDWFWFQFRIWFIPQSIVVWPLQLVQQTQSKAVRSFS